MSLDGHVFQILLEIQARRGHLPKVELEAVSRSRPDLPLRRLHELASFYPHFRLEPPSGLEVKVCRDMACRLAGSADLHAGIKNLADDFEPGRIEVGGVSCLGRCDSAPSMTIADHVFRDMTLSRARLLIMEALSSPEAAARLHDTPDERRGPTGWRIDPYEGREEYTAVRAYVANPNPEALLEKLKIGDLRGMGGAGVWAHQKWNDVRQAPGDQKYVVVNGDESEPSTFKDREILRRVPHVLLEGVILAGLVTGAKQGYVYIRHEYHEQIDAVREAIRRAEELGVCGSNVLGTGRSFPIEVFVSPGGYICGEQSALIEAMEGKRSEPRNKPPLLETNGLHDRPTLLSNVETFAWVPSIAVRGGEWYRDQGVNGHKGARFYSICGDLNRPGPFEVPNGLTLRSLIDDYAGGMKGGEIRAFAPSGPSGGFLPRFIPRTALARGFEKRVPERFLNERLPADATHLDILDLELDLQLFRDLGLMLGAGMAVYGPRADMLDQAVNATEFFRNESCGKCVPCRMGSRKTAELSASILRREHDRESLAAVEQLLGELKSAMELTSICGLGMVAANPVASVFKYFRDDISAYLTGERKPNGETTR